MISAASEFGGHETQELPFHIVLDGHTQYCWFPLAVDELMVLVEGHGTHEVPFHL